MEKVVLNEIKNNFRGSEPWASTEEEGVEAAGRGADGGRRPGRRSRGSSAERPLPLLVCSQQPRADHGLGLEREGALALNKCTVTSDAAVKGTGQEAWERRRGRALSRVEAGLTAKKFQAVGAVGTKARGKDRKGSGRGGGQESCLGHTHTCVMYSGFDLHFSAS